MQSAARLEENKMCVCVVVGREGEGVRPARRARVQGRAAGGGGGLRVSCSETPGCYRGGVMGTTLMWPPDTAMVDVPRPSAAWRGASCRPPSCSATNACAMSPSSSRRSEAWYQSKPCHGGRVWGWGRRASSGAAGAGARARPLTAQLLGPARRRVTHLDAALAAWGDVCQQGFWRTRWPTLEALGVPGRQVTGRKPGRVLEAPWFVAGLLLLHGVGKEGPSFCGQVEAAPTRPVKHRGTPTHTRPHLGSQAEQGAEKVHVERSRPLHHLGRHARPQPSPLRLGAGSLALAEFERRQGVCSTAMLGGRCLGSCGAWGGRCREGRSRRGCPAVTDPDSIPWVRVPTPPPRAAVQLHASSRAPLPSRSHFIDGTKEE